MVKHRQRCRHVIDGLQQRILCYATAYAAGACFSSINLGQTVPLAEQLHAVCAGTCSQVRMGHQRRRLLMLILVMLGSVSLQVKYCTCTTQAMLFARSGIDVRPAAQGFQGAPKLQKGALISHINGLRAQAVSKCPSLSYGVLNIGHLASKRCGSEVQCCEHVPAREKGHGPASQIAKTFAEAVTSSGFSIAPIKDDVLTSRLAPETNLQGGRPLWQCCKLVPARGNMTCIVKPFAEAFPLID